MPYYKVAYDVYSTGGNVYSSGSNVYSTGDNLTAEVEVRILFLNILVTSLITNILDLAI